MAQKPTPRGGPDSANLFPRPRCPHPSSSYPCSSSSPALQSLLDSFQPALSDTARPPPLYPARSPAILPCARPGTCFSPTVRPHPTPPSPIISPVHAPSRRQQLFEAPSAVSTLAAVTFFHTNNDADPLIAQRTTVTDMSPPMYDRIESNTQLFLSFFNSRLLPVRA